MDLKRQLGLSSAILIIIADVIGTGIFVTTGSVLRMTGSPSGVILLWVAGGLTAVTGSLCYAELAAMWPEDGGEYVYLRKTYGLLPAFLTGWISLTVGFTASTAATSLTLVWYMKEFFGTAFPESESLQQIIAASFILLFSFLHIVGVKRGGFVQNFLTIIKLLIVFSLIVFGFSFIDWSFSSRIGFSQMENIQGSSGIAAYGLALLIVMFAYSGWNGTSYIAGEIKNPQKNLPRAMFFGTLAVTAIYILLNIVFLMSSPAEQLMASHAVAATAAENLFGSKTAPLLILGIALVLLSSVSVQMMVGPRVYYAMAKDGLIFSKLSRINPRFSTPDAAIIMQMIIAVIYVFIGKNNIEGLLAYMGFSLGIFPLLAVIGMMMMRFKSPGLPRPFKTPLFPLVPLVYIILTTGMMTAALIMWTKTSLFAIGVLCLGIVVFFVWRAAGGGKK
jgi:APA family basic amino acid/polyamine antiporter